MLRFTRFNDGLIARAAVRVYIISPRRRGEPGFELSIYSERVTAAGTRYAFSELDTFESDDLDTLLQIADANAATAIRNRLSSRRRGTEQ